MTDVSKDYDGSCKRIIITGPPGSGKTTLIKEIEKAGFPILDEAARNVIINQQQIANSNLVPWKDVQGFSSLVLQKILKDLNPKHELIFCDRGIPDIISYLKLARLDVSEEYYRATQEANYFSNVFICPIWEEIYVMDEQRKESIDEAQALQTLLSETYQELGFNVIAVPKIPVKERCQWILKALGL